MSKQHYSIFPVFVIGVICAVSILAMPPLGAWAALPGPQAQDATETAIAATRALLTTPTPPDRPPTSTPIVPDRPIITPTPTLTSTPRPISNSAAIELNVQFLPNAPADANWRESLWTMVAWQDGFGEWHIVEGWKSNLDEVKSSGGRKIWYVSDDQFGKGPFSWLVSPGPEGDPIAASLPFNMPSSAGVIVPVKVAVGKPVSIAPVEGGVKSAIPETGGQQHMGLRAGLTVLLIVLLIASLMTKGWRRRIE